MQDEPVTSGEYDLDEIEKLLRLMVQYGARKVELHHGDTSLTVEMPMFALAPKKPEVAPAPAPQPHPEEPLDEDDVQPLDVDCACAVGHLLTIHHSPAGECLLGCPVGACAQKK